MRVLIVVAMLTLASQPAGAGTIKKWVDERGATHYGDTIPPQFVNQGSTEMSAQGIVIKKNERAMTVEERKALEDERIRQQDAQLKDMEQQRRDKALLNTYTSEQWQRPENCIARDVVGSPIDYALLPHDKINSQCIESPMQGFQVGTFAGGTDFTTTVDGTVTGINLESGEPMLQIGGLSVPVSGLRSINGLR